MMGGFVAYLMVAVPFGGLLAAWGFAVRRRGHPRAGAFMLAWGAGGLVLRKHAVRLPIPRPAVQRAGGYHN